MSAELNLGVETDVASPAPADAGGEQQAEAGSDPAAGQDTASQEGAEQPADQSQQDDAGQSATPEAEGQEAEASAQAPDLPEGFESVEQLVTAFKEQQATLGKSQQQSSKAPEQQARQPFKSQFEGWDEGKWVNAFKTNPLQTIQKAAEEMIVNGGIGHEILQEAERRVLERLNPLLGTLEPIVINTLCDELQTEYPEVFPTYRAEVAKMVKATGQKPKDAFFHLLAKSAKKANTKAAQAGAVLQQKSQVAQSVQAGGVRPASAARPPAPEKPDGLGRLIGTKPKSRFSV